MFFQKPTIKIFLFGLIAFTLASCDQNNATTESQTENSEKTNSPPITSALEELETKAENGNPDAQQELGVMYRNGEGVRRDYDIALHWFRLAADRELVRGQNNLGAAAGQYNLGVMYKNGEGVPENKIAAYMWFYIATDYGSFDAIQASNEIIKGMTSGQINEAERLIRKWKMEH